MRGDGRVYERGGKLWIAYYAPGPNGKRVQVRESSDSGNWKVAKALLKKRVLERDIARARGMRFLGPAAERITVGQILDSLLLDYRLRKIASIREVGYQIKHIREHFGHWRAISVTTAAVRSYVDMRREAKAADATIDHELEQLRAAYRLAGPDGDKVIGEVPKIPTLGASRRNARQVWFELAEVADFLAAALELDRDGYDFYRHLWISGLRPKALRSFTWNDVDVEKWTLRIPTIKDKNGYPRTLVLDGELLEVFKSRLARRYPGCDLVHHHEGKPITETWAMSLFKAACKKVGIPTGRKKGKTPYDLKRTALEAMLKSGMPIQRAMIQSGHKTEATFLRYGMREDISGQREDILRRDAYLKANMPTARTEQLALLPMEKKA